MSDLGLAIDEARAEIADAAGEFMPDVCTIFALDRVEDDAGGWTDTYTQKDSNVPCQYRVRSAFEQSSADKVKSVSSHEFKLPVTDKTMLIDGTYKLAVLPRANVPERTFQVTGRLDDSMTIFVLLGATLEGA